MKFHESYIICCYYWLVVIYWVLTSYILALERIFDPSLIKWLIIFQKVFFFMASNPRKVV